MQQQVVAADREAGRSQTIQPLHATGHVENASATAAVEVVMVARGRLSALVTGLLAGNGDRHHQAFGEKRAQSPVDSSDAERGDMPGGETQHLRGAERPFRLLDHSADRVPLFRIPDHLDGLKEIRPPDS
jgi:hypothetical protein